MYEFLAQRGTGAVTWSPNRGLPVPALKIREENSFGTEMGLAGLFKRLILAGCFEVPGHLKESTGSLIPIAF